MLGTCGAYVAATCDFLQRRLRERFHLSGRRAAAQDEGADSISALPTPSGPDESTPAADYVRKPTDPPPFNPKKRPGDSGPQARGRAAQGRAGADDGRHHGGGASRQRKGHDLATSGGGGEAGHPDSLHGDAAVRAGARRAAEQRHDAGGRTGDRDAVCRACDGDAVRRAGDGDAVRRASVRDAGQRAVDGAAGESISGGSARARAARRHGGAALCHPGSCQLRPTRRRPKRTPPAGHAAGRGQAAGRGHAARWNASARRPGRQLELRWRRRSRRRRRPRPPSAGSARTSSASTLTARRARPGNRRRNRQGQPPQAPPTNAPNTAAYPSHGAAADQPATDGHAVRRPAPNQ